MKRVLWLIVALAGGPAMAGDLPINSEAVVMGNALACDLDALVEITERDFANDTVLKGYLNRSFETNRCRYLAPATPVVVSDHRTAFSKRRGDIRLTKIRMVGDTKERWIMSSELAPL